MTSMSSPPLRAGSSTEERGSDKAKTAVQSCPSLLTSSPQGSMPERGSRAQVGGGAPVAGKSRGGMFQGWRLSLATTVRWVRFPSSPLVAALRRGAVAAHQSHDLEAGRSSSVRFRPPLLRFRGGAWSPHLVVTQESASSNLVGTASLARRVTVAREALNLVCERSSRSAPASGPPRLIGQDGTLSRCKYRFEPGGGFTHPRSSKDEHCTTDAAILVQVQSGVLARKQRYGSGGIIPYK